MKLRKLYGGFFRDLFSSADLKSRVSNSTGTGPVVFSDSPTFTGTPTVSSGSTSTFAPSKRYVDVHRDGNIIINGGMDVSQENGDNVGTTNGYYPADMFTVGYLSDGTFSLARENFGAHDNTLPSGLWNYLAFRTTAVSSAPATEYAFITYGVEGNHVRNWNQGAGFTEEERQYVTLSFWCKTNGPKTYSVSIRKEDLAYSIVKPFTTVGDGWERISLSWQLSGDGTWNYDENLSFEINWNLTSSSQYLAPQDDVWQAGNYVGSSTMDTIMDSTDNYFFLSGVDLRLGQDNAPERYIPRNYEEELRKCQRYFWAAPAGAIYNMHYNASSSFAIFELPVEMRIPIRDCSKTITLSAAEINPNQYHKGNRLAQFYVNGAPSNSQGFKISARFF